MPTATATTTGTIASVEASTAVVAARREQQLQSKLDLIHILQAINQLEEQLIEQASEQSAAQSTAGLSRKDVTTQLSALRTKLHQTHEKTAVIKRENSGMKQERDKLKQNVDELVAAFP